MSSQRRPRPGARRLTATLGAAAVVATTLLATAPTAHAADPVGFTCDPGSYRIVAAGSNLVLEVSQASGNHGAVAQNWWQPNYAPARWRVCHNTEPDGKEIYRFIGWRDRCMAVDRRFLGAGAWVLTDLCNETNGSHIGDNSQEFWLVRVAGTEFFALSPQHTQNSTRMWIASQDHSAAPGAQVVQSVQPDLFSMVRVD
ncbi:RICIN domain-containing protein [Streptomyces sp. NPDC052077]|uniref:RICIN domain-containing protein n=1 Tax=Streptomyces sp. NPDC052077 TaxID=3154757 RepID=UPI003413F2E1